MKGRIICLMVAIIFHNSTIASGLTDKISRELAEAELGDQESQNSMGQRYYRGEGVKRNFIEAFKWLMKAAEKGHPRAQNTLGFMFEKGRGVKINYKEALKFYQMAADQGHSIAQFNMGIMFRRGLGTTKNLEKAVTWFKKSAALGNQHGQCYLAEMYEKGRGGLPKDYSEAIRYYELAEKQGNKRAILRLKELLSKISSANLIVKTFEQPECSLCLTEKSNVVFDPCGHISCQKCAALLKQTCPMCRKKIAKVLTFYL